MISIVVPTYKRKQNIAKTVELLEKLSEYGVIYELIFVDDGSEDGTSDVLKAICLEKNHVRGIVLNQNVGQQNATLAGIRSSQYPYICTLDDDLSYDPESIIALFDELKKGYDVVYGVPSDEHEKYYRKWGTKLKEMLFFLALEKPAGLRLTSFRIMNKKTRNIVSDDMNSRVYLSACILKSTKNISNFKVHRLTKGSPTNYTLWKLVKLMVQIIIGYTWIKKSPLKMRNKKQYVIKEIFNETSRSRRQ